MHAQQKVILQIVWSVCIFLLFLYVKILKYDNNIGPNHNNFHLYWYEEDFTDGMHKINHQLCQIVSDEMIYYTQLTIYSIHIMNISILFV